jgi:hypothetical protein
MFRLGSWVETGDILVGKLMPQIASELSYIAEAGLLRAIFGLEVSTSKETSLKLLIGDLLPLQCLFNCSLHPLRPVFGTGFAHPVFTFVLPHGIVSFCFSSSLSLPM